ncbi:MAG: hydrogenase 3 maturation endopeptidase HyCI [Candidatus Omnitrophica bacterium]|nr:hydrogenase 3 maturation endopeptidase HyCI [Candidatus Omnitrophota bacterium]
MENRLLHLLKSSLSGARRIAVLGIGSEFRGDDAAGMLVSNLIAKKKFQSKKTKIQVFLGATAPENITGEIKRFKPTHVVIIDSMEVGQKPGTILVIDPKDIGGATFSTHTMPAKILAMYLARSTRCKIIIIGIQSKSVGFGDPLSSKVSESADIVSRSFLDAVRSIGRKRADA